VPQPRHDPASDHLDADLNLGFITRLIGPRRDDRSAVMPRHVGIGAVDQRRVERGLDDAGLQIVADRLARDPAEISDGADTRSDPIWQLLGQLLAPGRLGPRVRRSAGPRTGSGEAGGAEHGDKNLYRDSLAGTGIDHLAGAAGEIDKQFLAGDMDLAHCRLQPAGPGSIQIAEPGNMCSKTYFLLCCGQIYVA
jgi:hypothetical protein